MPTNRSDTAGYSRSVGMSSFTTGYRYTIEAYDIANSYAKVVIVYGGMADVEIKSDTPPSLITSVSRKISSTGDGQVYSIEVYEDGHIKVYETENITSDYEEMCIRDSGRRERRLSGWLPVCRCKCGGNRPRSWQRP